MKQSIKHNSVYILLYIFILCVVGYVLLSDGKVQIHMAMNEVVGNKFLNVFFKWITHLGDGAFAFLVAFVFLFFSIRKSVYIIISYLGSALVSSVLKHIFYPEIYRPHFVFNYFVRINLKLVDGIEMFGFNSFPSGHALSAFALFFCLLLITKNHFLKILYFILAILAAYSRVYLSQHWLIDIYIGSIIGVSFAVFFYATFYYTSKWKILNTTLPQLLIKIKSTRV